MHRSLLVPMFAVFALSLGACDKGADKKADKKVDAEADAKKAEAKKADDKADDKPAAEKPPEAKHFAIDSDKSGALARTAAVLETTDVTSEDSSLREHLAGVSHHAEALTSDEVMCRHMISVRKAAGEPEGTLESCVIHFEHEVVLLGPEVFAQMSQCVMDAKTAAEIDVCEVAEKEAEGLLHDKHHGDGLSDEVCTALFEKFEELAMADAGEHKEAVKGVLEEVRADSIQACKDQGTQAEVDCTMKSDTMEALVMCETTI